MGFDGKQRNGIEVEEEESLQYDYRLRSQNLNQRKFFMNNREVRLNI